MGFMFTQSEFLFCCIICFNCLSFLGKIREIFDSRLFLNLSINFKLFLFSLQMKLNFSRCELKLSSGKLYLLMMLAQSWLLKNLDFKNKITVEPDQKLQLI